MARRDWKKELGWTDVHTDEMRHAAYAYVRQGKYDIALPLFEGLVVLEPEDVYSMQVLGALYVQLGEPLKAIKHLDQALQIDADHGPTLLNLTKAFFMAGRIEDGLRLAKILKNDKDPYISGNSSALIMCYSRK
jgi:tetratricopeptide (TPR) repeat protein